MITFILNIPLNLILWYFSLFTNIYFLIFWVPYSIASYFILKHIMKETVKYREIPDDKKDFHQKYDHMRRLDAVYWKEINLYIGAILFSWIKIAMALIGIISTYLALKIALFGKNPETQNDENMSKKIKYISYISGRFISFSLGITYIYEETPNIDYTEYLGANYDKNAVPATFISNHVSWLDIFLYMAKLSPGFIAKAPVMEYPLIGYIARCLGCMFIKRTEKGDRNNVINQVIEKQKAILEKKDFSNFLIFVEGTTSNGTSLLSFKKGAFLNNVPVKPSLIILNRESISLAMDVIEMLYHLFIVICTPYFTVKLIKMPVFAPNEYLYTKSKFADEKKEKWEIFAEAVRDAMSKAGNLEKSNLTYEDKLSYLQFFRNNKED